MAQYKRFFPLVDELALAPAATRAAQLSAVAANPLRDSVLKNLAKIDAQGVGFYGPTAEVNPRITLISKDTAVIEDCQDTSKSGTKRKSDGKLLTVGRKNSAVTSTLTLGTDGVWRVSIVTYQGKDVPCRNR